MVQTTSAPRCRLFGFAVLVEGYCLLLGCYWCVMYVFPERCFRYTAYKGAGVQATMSTAWPMFWFLSITSIDVSCIFISCDSSYTALQLVPDTLSHAALFTSVKDLSYKFRTECLKALFLSTLTQHRPSTNMRLVRLLWINRVSYLHEKPEHVPSASLPWRQMGATMNRCAYDSSHPSPRLSRCRLPPPCRQRF